MKTLAGVVWCSAIVFVAGCASSGVSMHSWLGRTETDLVTAWGRPATTESDGQGGRILTYYAVTDWVANNRVRNPPDVRAPRTGGGPEEDIDR